MTNEKALEILKQVVLSEKDSEVIIKDDLQFRIAITILSKNYTIEQLQELIK